MKTLRKFRPNYAALNATITAANAFLNRDVYAYFIAEFHEKWKEEWHGRAMAKESQMS